MRIRLFLQALALIILLPVGISADSAALPADQNKSAYSLDNTSQTTPESNLSSILRDQQSDAQQIDAPIKSTLENPGKESFFYSIADAQDIAAGDPPDPGTTPDPANNLPQEFASISPAAAPQTALINFNNVGMVEYVRFVSRISNRNFIFDESDLQFNVTIISEEPATIENIMTALLQELRIHDLQLIEDNNSLIIHKNPKVNGISRVVAEGLPPLTPGSADIITQVFRLNTLDAEKAVTLIRPLTSDTALIEPLKDLNQLVVTDITANVGKIALLLKSLDAPNSSLVIGQYVSRITPIDTLIPLAQQIMSPISQDQTLSFIPHPSTNSIFIVASPFLVERTISILEYLDEDQGATRILDLKDMKFGEVKINPKQLKTLSGQWVSNAQGNWVFKPTTNPTLAPSGGLGGPNQPPLGSWSRDYEGMWDFNPNGEAIPGAPAPKGRWVKDVNGNWTYEVDKEEEFKPGTFVRQEKAEANLPGGKMKPTKFYIYKLRYRKGSSIEPEIRQIADTLQQNEKGNEDLINAMRSVQWLATPNSLVFSGDESSLSKAAALVKEMDKPLRQVLIEMLILETTLTDSLQFGVAYGTRFGGGNLSGAQTFYSGTTSLLSALGSTGISGLGQVVGSQQVLVPNGASVSGSPAGFNLGVIGQKITHCGTEFGSLGAMINALHDRLKDKVISNPKLLVEDNSPAELFVGLNTPYRTQSLSNDIGSVITSNYEYLDVGTSLKVTPYLGNGEIIGMDIQEEVSTLVTPLATLTSTTNTSPGPTTRLNRTTTRVNIPNGYFLIISGMMQEEISRERNQVPCLGGIPILGAALSDKNNTDGKRNLMIFIRPQIIDTEEDVQTITKRQQDIYDYKNCMKNFDEYEVSEALDLFNIRNTLHPEDTYDCDCESNKDH
ncbi:MAG: type III secretion protein [Parachlamydiaceae bacterium]